MVACKPARAAAGPPEEFVKWLADENFDNDIVRGLVRRVPEFDIVRVQDVGLSGEDDPALLD